MACKKSRDHPEAAAAFAGQLTDTLTLPMRRLDVAPIGALALALVWGLSVNDATYSWLAAALRLPLLTFDRQVAAGAAEMGLS